MIRCNGFCSGRRAIPATRTPAGEPLLLHNARRTAALRPRILRRGRASALAELAALPEARDAKLGRSRNRPSSSRRPIKVARFLGIGRSWGWRSTVSRHATRSYLVCAVSGIGINHAEKRSTTALSRVSVDTATKRQRLGGDLRATKYISMRQCSNLMEAVQFAKAIGLPLVAHLTLHWSLTDIGDDPNGALFAKVREGLNKWLHRRGVAFAAVWSRERQSGGQSDVVHCHLLFHLPVKYRKNKKLLHVEAAILVWSDCTVGGLHTRRSSSS